MHQTKIKIHFQNCFACGQSLVAIFAICLFFVVVTTSRGESHQSSPAVSPSVSPSSPWNLSLGNRPRPKNARTLVDAEGGAWFDDGSNTVEFFDKVVVHDPQFTLSCDKLRVEMNKNRQGLKLVTATGNVVIEQEHPNEQGETVKVFGKAGETIYDPITGNITLKYWPQIQQGSNYQIATEPGTVMILNGKGTLHTQGQSRTMIVDQVKKEEAKSKE
ncbi:MAG TPA: LptA/OstA family protein [Chthoniobacterales bacterium]|nr:LptA/OstA family protein [Chthoniobacterales bacterium]